MQKSFVEQSQILASSTFDLAAFEYTASSSYTAKVHLCACAEHMCTSLSTAGCDPRRSSSSSRWIAVPGFVSSSPASLLTADICVTGRLCWRRLIYALLVAFATEVCVYALSRPWQLCSVQQGQHCRAHRHATSSCLIQVSSSTRTLSAAQWWRPCATKLMHMAAQETSIQA